MTGYYNIYIYQCLSVHPYVCPHARTSALCFRSVTSVVFDGFSWTFAEVGVGGGGSVSAAERLFFCDLQLGHFKTVICETWSDFYSLWLVSRSPLATSSRFAGTLIWPGEEWFRIAFIENKVMALDWCQNFVFPKYLFNKWMPFYKILYMHSYL